MNIISHITFLANMLIENSLTLPPLPFLRPFSPPYLPPSVIPPSLSFPYSLPPSVSSLSPFFFPSHIVSLPATQQHHLQQSAPTYSFLPTQYVLIRTTNQHKFPVWKRNVVNILFSRIPIPDFCLSLSRRPVFV